MRKSVSRSDLSRKFKPRGYGNVIVDFSAYDPKQPLALRNGYIQRTKQGVVPTWH